MQNTKLIMNSLLVAAIVGYPAFGQTASSSAGRLLPAVTLPAGVSDFRSALSGVFDKAGHERRILQGTVSYGGTTVPFTFTRELDQKVRLDLNYSAGTRSLIVASIPRSFQASQTAAGPNDQTNHDILETLASDAPEALLYLYGSSSGVISMGARYQPPGTTASYPGPFWDWVMSHENSPYQPNSPSRLKQFAFDNGTKLLTSVKYVTSNGIAEIDYTGWATTANGESCPGQITRSVAGNLVLTITVTSCDAAATATDGLFSL